MAEKLYLIRRNLETFLGPLAFEELRQSYRRLEFGLQDEIAASFREWVAFDDLEKIRETYPEVASFVRAEMLAGWGVERPVKASVSRIKSTLSKSVASRSWLPTVAAVLVAISAFSAFYLARHGELLGRFFSSADPNIERARELQRGAPAELFENYMDRYRREILGTLTQRNGQRDWLPLLRSIAYRRDGRIEGLSLQLLRGQDGASAPKDCSLASWKRTWARSEPEWTSFLNGQVLPQGEWARVLLWDPAWIQRRSPSPGWLEPRSYHEACISMGLKALQQTPAQSPKATEARATILARLLWQAQMLQGEAIENVVAMAGSLWTLSCLESSEKIENLEECRSRTPLQRDWDLIIAQRLVQAKAQILLSRNSGAQMNTADVESLRTILPDLHAKDAYTRFDYEAELRFYQTVVSTGGKLQKAHELMAERYPDLNLAP